MTWVDLAVLGVLAVSALLAFLRGFVREVLGIGAWIGAAAVAVWGAQYARTPVERWIDSPDWAEPVALIGIFLVALIILLLVAHLLGRLVRGSPLGGLDRTLGLLFGLGRGAALVVIAYILAGNVVPVDHWPNPVRDAIAMGPTYQAARWVRAQLPDGFRPNVPKPPAGLRASPEALMRATPQGRALGTPRVRE
ncbi:MAG TPA: CvpA family protein [Acetobacteraceae bacterium]|nr:CvpA family protein [Acetobacteraceae bacterium]